MQDALGADIVMVFDECTAYPGDRAAARESMQLSLRWAKRSRAHYYDALKRDGRDSDAALFGIVQGGVHLTSAAGIARGARDDYLELGGRRPRRRRARGRTARVLEGLAPHCRPSGRAT